METKNKVDEKWRKLIFSRKYYSFTSAFLLVTKKNSCLCIMQHLNQNYQVIFKYPVAAYLRKLGETKDFVDITRHSKGSDPRSLVVFFIRYMHYILYFLVLFLSQYPTHQPPNLLLEKSSSSHHSSQLNISSRILFRVQNFKYHNNMFVLYHNRY